MNLKILIVDDERPARFGMVKALKGPGHQLLEAEDGATALRVIREELPDLVFLDLNMPGMNGLELLGELGNDRDKDCRTVEIVIVTANDDIQSAVECMRLGAADYITKPFEIEQLRACARRSKRRVELEQRVSELQNQLDESQAFGALVGISKPMRELFARMQRVAAAPIDVLIRGETGTGKELIAREIHRLSPRARGPFVAVNTAAIAESLAESELFGHVRGAFTGADANRQGCFELANGGTLFLDEIGDMPLPTQSKILRTLQERRVQPVGSSKTIPVDVRVITATWQNLDEAIGSGHFRQDLYYRIRGVELQVPPLRSRYEDIGLLAHYFLQKLADSLPEVPSLAPSALAALLTYDWPGNVRQLENTITGAALMATSAQIQASDLNLPAAAEAAPPTFASLMDLPLTEAKERLIEEFERTRINAALEKNDGNVSAAARDLGIHRQNLQQKITQLGIRRAQASE